MHHVSILDCTLRDGGYINNWRFKDQHIAAIIHALGKAGVEHIECGYLSGKSRQVEHNTMFASPDLPAEVFARAGVDAPDALFDKLYLMVNFGDFAISDLPRRSPRVPGGLRVAFHKKDYPAAVDFIGKAVDKGYRVCVQPMITSLYSDKELLDLIERSAGLGVAAFYVVDSMGAMDSRDLTRLASLVDHNLPDGIQLGFHSHNNMQLAYSNAQQLLAMGLKRPIMLDSSIFGMGRGAGNLNTEIITDFLNKHHAKTYDIYPILEVIDDILEALYRETYWGYSVAHFLSASLGCHPNYASFLLGKKKLRVTSIREILERIPSEKRYAYDANFAEELYFQHNRRASGITELSQICLRDREILLLASGPSLLQHADKVERHIEEKSPLVVALNHIPQQFRADVFFFSNPKRHAEFAHRLPAGALVYVTSNIDRYYCDQATAILDYDTLLAGTSGTSDNVALLFMSYLAQCGIERAAVAGLDGYDVLTPNDHAYREYGAILDPEEKRRQNAEIMRGLEVLKGKLALRFLTPSLFDRAALRVLGVIPARFASSRFPGKPLTPIKGMPMIERTYRRARQSTALDDLVVATDDARIADFCAQRGIPFVMTSLDCLTGTDRVAEVARQLDFDLYVNIQGDEPVISPHAVDIVVEAFKQHSEAYVAYNLMKPIDDPDEIVSPTTIKVIANERGELMYMSRLPVPFAKAGETPAFLKQVCVYGFTREALHIFTSTGKTRNERHEDIEILRFLDLGHKVLMIPTDCESIAVDLPSDVAKVERFLDSTGQE